MKRRQPPGDDKNRHKNVKKTIVKDDKNDNLKFYWKKGKVDRLRGHTNVEKGRQVEKTETIEKKARGNWKDDTNLMKIRNTREKDDRKKHRKYHTFYLKNMTNLNTNQW